MSYFTFMQEIFFNCATPEGDLAVDMQNDPFMIDFQESQNSRNDYAKLRQYLQEQGACKDALRTLRDTWHMYVNYCKSHQLPERVKTFPLKSWKLDDAKRFQQELFQAFSRALKPTVIAETDSPMLSFWIAADGKAYYHGCADYETFLANGMQGVGGTPRYVLVVAWCKEGHPVRKFPTMELAIEFLKRNVGKPAKA